MLYSSQEELGEIEKHFKFWKFKHLCKCVLFQTHNQKSSSQYQNTIPFYLNLLYLQKSVAYDANVLFSLIDLKLLEIQAWIL
jgi:hypothetical protein